MSKDKTIMESFFIDEISAVDRPAQEGARALIIKRDEGTTVKKEWWYKNPFILSDVDGHTHIFEDDGGAGGETSWAKSSNEDTGHTHPWVRDMTGLVEIGMSEGHTHKVILKKAVNGEEPNPMTNKKDVEMVEKSKLDQVSADLARAEAFGALNDLEKNHYYSLDAEAQSDFLKLDADGRKSEVEKAQESDPVVYKDLDGNEFRKSDDPRAVSAAKRADKALAKAREAEERAEAQELEKRANEELKNLPGDLEVKKALLKAIDGIEDEETRKGALELVKSGNDNLAEAFTTKGVKGEPASTSLDNEYEKLAEQYAKDNSCSIEIARAEVLEKTDAGRELCKKMYSERS